MKKVLLALLVACVVIGMVGCSPGDNETLNKAPEQSVSETPRETTPTPPIVEKNVFVQIEEKLQRSGIKFEKVTMAAEMVGAEAGVKFKTDTGKIEIYRFAKDSEALSQALKNQEVAVEGFGALPAEVFGQYAMISDMSGEEKTVVEDIVYKILK